MHIYSFVNDSLDFFCQHHSSQKRKKHMRWPSSYCSNSLCASISPHWCRDFLVQFFVGVAAALAHARSAQTQAKSSAEHREYNRHRFVLSPSRSQTAHDNINCFLGLWQLSSPRHRNTLKPNTSPFHSLLNTEAISGLCIRMALGFMKRSSAVIVVQRSFLGAYFSFRGTLRLVLLQGLDFNLSFIATQWALWLNEPAWSLYWGEKNLYIT